MRKAATFPQSETEYLFVGMKNIPVCLRFQQSVSILFPWHLGFIRVLCFPISWRDLSLSPHPPTPNVSALIILSFGVWGVSRQLYLFSTREAYPFNCIMPHCLHISFLGGRVCFDAKLWGTDSTPLHVFLCQGGCRLCPLWRLTEELSPSPPFASDCLRNPLCPAYLLCLESRPMNACFWFSVLHVVCFCFVGVEQWVKYILAKMCLCRELYNLKHFTRIQST